MWPAVKQASAKTRLLVAVVFTIAIVCLLSSCGNVAGGGSTMSGDYEISLPNGYSIIRESEGMVSVINTKLPDIEANVDGYRVYHNYMVGHVSKCRDKSRHSQPGYFILEFYTGKAYQGLSKKQWLTMLRSYGIKQPPVLHVPSGSDEMKGHNRPTKP